MSDAARPAADPALVERLGKARAFKSVPKKELEWFAARGIMNRRPAGTYLDPKVFPVVGVTVILGGSLAMHVEHGGVRRRVMAWHEGDLIGALPFSRMGTSPPGQSWVTEDIELFTVVGDHYPELIRECPELTAVCVHTMLDRARVFTSAYLQDEKMVSLGKLSAGLAHELNNPASAAARSSQRLAEQMKEAEDASRALTGMALDEVQQRRLDEVRAMCLVVPPSFLDTPLDRADRVEALVEWLDAHGCDVSAAAALAETAVTLLGLDKLAAALPDETLVEAVRWLAACCAVRSAATEIQTATKRISDLVAAVKGFTYMGRATAPEPVNLGRGLQDTVRILGSKARDKAVTITLEVAPDLPLARGLGSELNQIWANLLENALDAVAYGGRIVVRAQKEIDWIVVRVIDDGHGIPDEIKDRIFDPFFTTKPVGEGTGMGLEIARRLVFQQGGEIDVESRPGNTEFRVAIPAAAASSGPPAS